MTLLGVVTSARAQSDVPDGPPDVANGERYDGRPHDTSVGWKTYALELPRMLLVIPRLLLEGIGIGAEPLMEANETYHIADRALSALQTEDGKVKVSPIINFQSGYKTSFGLSLFDSRFKHGVEMTLSSEIGSRYILIEKAHFKLPLPGGHSWIDLDALYFRRDDMPFTGYGMNDHNIKFTRYSIDQGDLMGSYMRQLHRVLKMDVGAELGIRRYGDGHRYNSDPPISQRWCVPQLGGQCHEGKRVDEAKVPGFYEGTQFVRPHATLRIDTRRDPVSSGLLAEVNLQYTHGFADGDDSSYLRWHARVGGTVELFSRNTLYLGVGVDDLHGFGSHPIPFSELVTLGGPDDLRGFRALRFRDFSSVVGTLEYRWPVYVYADAIAFVDYGGVFKENFADFHWNELRPAVGGGLRVHTKTKLIIRLQVAYGFGDRGGWFVSFAGEAKPL